MNRFEFIEILTYDLFQVDYEWDIDTVCSPAILSYLKPNHRLGQCLAFSQVPQKTPDLVAMFRHIYQHLFKFCFISVRFRI